MVLRMETEIAQLVSDVFVARRARDIQHEQLVSDNAAAVRGAILLHARPVLNPHDHHEPDASLSSEPLSASTWKRLSSILAALMPAFWFGVIKGLWGSARVG
jgi:hypothetical protein